MALLVLLIILFLIPSFTSRYFISFMIFMLMYVTLAESWNMLSGYTGYFSFGHSCFFGAGAYTFILCMTKLKLNYILALMVAGAIAGVLGLIISFILMGKKIGIAYFAIMTLGLSEVLKTIVANTETLGSSYGFTISAIPSLSIAYYIFLALAISSTLLTAVIDKSKFGLGLKSILEDEDVADSIGINTFKYKVFIFILSSIFPGISGGVIAWYWSYIDPYLAFDLTISFDVSIMCILGGIGTIWGPVIGAVFLSILIEFLWVKVPYFHAIVLGFLVILIVLIAPGGLFELGEGLFLRLIKSGAKN